MVTAGFEGDVEGRSVGSLAGLAQGQNLGVGTAMAFMPAAGDDGALPINDHGPDHGIRLDPPPPFRRQGQRERHGLMVVLGPCHSPSPCPVVRGVSQNGAAVPGFLGVGPGGDPLVAAGFPWPGAFAPGPVGGLISAGAG